MTLKEYVDFSIKLQSLQVDLMPNKNIDMWLTFREEKTKGKLLDVSLLIFLDDNKKPTKEYRYNFLKEATLSETKDKFDDMIKVIHTFA